MITNNCNVWQPPVAKHCPIIPFLLTTTNLHPPAAAVAAAPRKCPHGPREGALIAACDVYATSSRTIRATSPPTDRLRVRHIRFLAPPIVEGCGRTDSNNRPTTACAPCHVIRPNRPPLTATSPPNAHCPCHVIQRNSPPSNATSRRLRERGGWGWG